MDTGEGTFKTFVAPTEFHELEEEYPKHGGAFTVGETIEIRGSSFLVRKITKKDIVLRLLPR